MRTTLAFLLLASTAHAANMTMRVFGDGLAQTGQTRVGFGESDGDIPQYEYVDIVDGVATYTFSLPHQEHLFITLDRWESSIDLLGFLMPMGFYGLAQKSWVDVELTSVEKGTVASRRWHFTFSANGVAPQSSHYNIPYEVPGHYVDVHDRVNGQDFLAWQRAYGTGKLVEPHQPRYGTIGTDDRLDDWERRFGYDSRFHGWFDDHFADELYGAAAVSGAVPEPGALVLGLAGIAGIACIAMVSKGTCL